MKNHHVMFGLSITASLIITILLIVNAMALKPKNIVYNDFVTSMDKWTYNTSLDNEHKEIKLPWVPEYMEENMTIYMKSKIPDILCSKALFIETYMKQIKVIINGEVIYNSEIANPETLTKASGRGVHFVDIPLRYSGQEIELQVFSPFSQNKGIIETVSISNKAAHIINIIKSNGFENIVAFTMIFAGIGAISIFLVTFLGSQKYINILCIGIFSISCGVWIIGESNLYQVIYNNSIIGYLLEFISFYVMPVPLLVYISTTYTLKYKKVVKWLIGVFTVFLLVTLISQVSGVLQLHEFVNVYHIIIVVGMIILIPILLTELKGSNRDFMMFFIGCTLMLMCGLIDLFLFYIKPIKTIAGFYKIGMGLFTVILAITVGRYILVATEKKAKHKVLMNLAYEDITTGLSNRRLFDEIMDDINNNIDYNSNISIIVVDLDNLKKTNDSKGHAEGDRLILLSSYILKEAYNSVGKAFRIGGDEFVILCENKSTLEIEKCHQKREVLIEKYRKETNKNIGMSWGIAYYNNETDVNIYDTFTRADKNMYKNKLEKKKITESAEI